MSWVKIDDGFVEHPKIAKVGMIGAWLQLQALCYANRNLTDGFIPTAIAESFMRFGTIRVDDETAVQWTVGEHSGMQGLDLPDVPWPAKMVEAGLWEAVPHGYLIHDYSEYQPTKEHVLAERAKWATYKAKRRAPKMSTVDSTQDSTVESTGCPRSPVPVPVPVPQSRSVRLRVIAPAPRVKRASPKTPWPESFHLDDDLRAFAREGGLDPELEFGKCKDHALANGVLHADWRRAFRYWCRNAVEFRERRGARR